MIRRILFGFLTLGILFFIITISFHNADHYEISSYIAGITLNNSLLGDTPVQTPSGLVPIAELRTGAEIMTYNDSAGQWQYERVSEVYNRYSTFSIITIRFENGFTIRSTGSHVFRVTSGVALSSRTVVTAPSEAEGASLEGRWVAAREIERGDTLLTRGGGLRVHRVETATVETPVFNVTVEASHTLSLGEDNILTGDAAFSAPAPAEPTTRGGCFPAGTYVYTGSGLEEIQNLERGDLVYGWDRFSGLWEVQPVAQRQSHLYSGDIVAIETEYGTVTATGNHPFWVSEGEDLEDRPASQEVPLAEQGLLDRGRWVAARELQVGDRVPTRNGSFETVTSLSSYNDTIRVYNITVEEVHTYAVGEIGYTVHNKGSAEEAPSTMEDSESRSMPSEESAEPMLREDAPTGSSESGGAMRQQSASGLRAGYADDNQNYNNFLNFLEEYSHVPHIPINVSERIILEAQDINGESLPNAEVHITAEERTLAKGKTYANGYFYFFPSEHDDDIYRYLAEVTYNNRTITRTIDRQGSRAVPIVFDLEREDFQSVPVDILFILDTTGSMGEEIARLRQTIRIIYMNLASMANRPDIRFGMVLYKDRGDEYVTRTVGLTGDLDEFQAELDTVTASGGGDGPEDLQSALEAGIEQVQWRDNAVKLGFVITDAQAHLDYGQEYTYAAAAHNARLEGIKLFTVGTGGLPTPGEYLLRQISQYTGAKYIFLTYGEQGESEGGAPGSVSHHTGTDFETGRLESIIIRFAKEEIQHLTDTPLDSEGPYFSADPVEYENREETLGQLFTQAVSQLIDYSAFRIEENTPLAVLNIHSNNAALADEAEYLTERLTLTIYQSDGFSNQFRLIERANMEDILQEQELQLSGAVDPETVITVGSLLGAELLVSGTLFETSENYELFLRLLRVETGEVLSITRAVINQELLP